MLDLYWDWGQETNVPRNLLNDNLLNARPGRVLHLEGRLRLNEACFRSDAHLHDQTGA